MGDVTLNISEDSGADRTGTRFQVAPVRHSQQQQYQPQRNGQEQQQPASNIINSAQQLNANGGSIGGDVARGAPLDDGMTIEMYRTAPHGDGGDAEANERDTFPDGARTSVIPPRLSR